MCVCHRDTAAQDYSLLHELAKNLCEWLMEDLVEPESDSIHPYSTHMFRLIHELCHCVADLVPEAFSENPFPGV